MLVVDLATGAILAATTQFLPQLVQQNFGYTATWAGLVLTPGGLVTMAMMFVVARLASKVQPKYLIVAGAVIVAASMYDLTNVYGDLGFWFLARSRMLLGIGLPGAPAGSQVDADQIELLWATHTASVQQAAQASIASLVSERLRARLELP